MISLCLKDKYPWSCPSWVVVWISCLSIISLMIEQKTIKRRQYINSICRVSEYTWKRSDIIARQKNYLQTQKNRVNSRNGQMNKMRKVLLAYHSRNASLLSESLPDGGHGPKSTHGPKSGIEGLRKHPFGMWWFVLFDDMVTSRSYNWDQILGHVYRYSTRKQ